MKKKIKELFKLINFIILRIIFSSYGIIKSKFLNIINYNSKFRILTDDKEITENKLAIFALYCPTNFYTNVIHVANTLKDNGYKVVFVHSGKFKFDTSIFEDNGHILIERHAGGMDFISYKFGLKYIKTKKKKLDKILFLNDSIFYLKNFVKTFNLLDALKYDFICLNEVFNVHHHFSSFFFIVKKKIFENKNFENFFNDLKIDVNRRSFIRNTEVKLSTIIKNITDNIYVHYNIRFLINNFSDKKKSLSQNLIEIENNHTVHKYNLDGIKKNKIFYLKKDLLYKKIENLKNLLFILKNESLFFSDADKKDIKLFYKINSRFTKSFIKRLKFDGYL